jgi:2-phosphosulfolactate phosphatase
MQQDDAPRALVIDVLLAPVELMGEQGIGPGTVAIVVDVIRATTTLAVMCDRGCAQVLVAGDISAARACAAQHAAEGYLLAGEVGGVRPPGFDFGNSPLELRAAELAGRTLVFSTTNGTRAIRACAGARAILAGSLRNADAVCRAALQRGAAPNILPLPAELPQALPASQPEANGSGREAASETRVAAEGRPPDVVVVCSGRSGRPSLDDTWCAGFLVGRLEHLAAAQGASVQLRESAQIAWQVAAHAGSAAEVFARSDAGRSISKVGLGHDLALCAESNTSERVPLVVGTTSDGLLIVEYGR